jgi:hypothetical protein
MVSISPMLLRVDPSFISSDCILLAELARTLARIKNLAIDARYLSFDQGFGFDRDPADEIIAATQRRA